VLTQAIAHAIVDLDVIIEEDALAIYINPDLGSIDNTLPKQYTCIHTPHHSFMGASKKDYGQGFLQPVLNKTMLTRAGSVSLLILDFQSFHLLDDVRRDL
jgi:hypothetical protein